MPRQFLPGLLGALLVVTLVACGSYDARTSSATATSPPRDAVDPTATTAREGELTMEQVYARLDASLRQQGGVYHALVTGQRDAGIYSGSGVTELWVDIVHDHARSTSTSHERGGGVVDVSITSGGVRYSGNPQMGDPFPVSAMEAPTCYGAVAAVAGIIDCYSTAQNVTRSVERGESNGVATLVVITSGTLSGEDQQTQFVDRLSLDATTYLPIVGTSTGTIEYGEVHSMSGRFKYQHDFVSADTLAADFFSPTAIGYGPVDPVALLDSADLEVSIYWPGEQFTAGGDLPSLFLSSVQFPMYYDPKTNGQTATPQPKKVNGTQAPVDFSSFAAILNFSLSSHPFGSVVLTIQLWPATHWANVGSDFASYPCTQSEEIALAAGTATLYGTHRQRDASATATSCDQVVANQFVAVVEIGDTVLLIDAPDLVSDGPNATSSPYATHDAMLAVLHALTLHEP